MTDRLVWNGTKLYLGKRLAGEIIQDVNYPSTWRIRPPDGSLSDMVNRARAKDAAAVMAVATERNRRDNRREAAYSDYFKPPLSRQPSAQITALSSRAMM